VGDGEGEGDGVGVGLGDGAATSIVPTIAQQLPCTLQ
jgi:hypothetical protein